MKAVLNSTYGKNPLIATLCAETSPGSPVIMGGDPARQIGLAAGLGYDGVELHWGSPAEIPLAVIADACETHGIGVAAFATGRSYVRDGLNLIDVNDRIRDAAILRVQQFIDAAAPFQAKVMIGCIRGNIPEYLDREAAHDRLAEAVHRLASYGEARGVGLIFESINRYENNYLNTAAETAAFLRHYQLPNTKILLDTFHMNIEDPILPESIRDCGDILGYVHVADSNRWYPGAGHLGFHDVFSALRDIGYSGPISAECLPMPDSTTALRGWIDGVRSFL
ncbi:MAG: sugar phosphate isomerase/epimerase [Firmicutes bacterium HGW-Firmicutes-11]|nr:MAG: sugar phosphate isomerase/epimerase [Firmicutes bacterium HGW-Firmicutes-11]